jgi:hypothetical protein
VDLYDEFQRIVDALNARRIRYALIGGLAVALYARPRATEDVDLLVAVDDLESAIATLTALGYRPAGGAFEIAEGRARIHRLLKFEGADLVPVDLLVSDDVEIVRCLDQRTIVEWEGRPTAVVSVDGLRMLKRLRNSAMDRADLEALGPEP